MGLLDSIESMAMGGNNGVSGQDHASVAGALAQELQQNPGGFGSILSSLRNNGMGEHADAMQNGQAPQMNPDQVQTGMQGTGMLESVAARAGVSPEVAKVAMATVLPMILAHMSQNGGQAPQGNVLGGLLSRFI